MPGAVVAAGPCQLSASRSAHGPPSAVAGKMPVLNTVDVLSLVPRGSSAISIESDRQCRLQSACATFVPSTSSVTWTSRYRASAVPHDAGVAGPVGRRRSRWTGRPPRACRCRSASPRRTRPARPRRPRPGRWPPAGSRSSAPGTGPAAAARCSGRSSSWSGCRTATSVLVATLGAPRVTVNSTVAVPLAAHGVRLRGGRRGDARRQVRQRDRAGLRGAGVVRQRDAERARLARAERQDGRDEADELRHAGAARPRLELADVGQPLQRALDGRHDAHRLVGGRALAVLARSASRRAGSACSRRRPPARRR